MGMTLRTVGPSPFGRKVRLAAAVLGLTDDIAIEPVTVGTIGAACALGYLDFRGQVDWRARNPALIGWLDGFAAANPAFDKTRPDA